ncbi:MAG: GxxExxY protein [Bacteroidetes bacterium]|nr:GxxExxY protein [Bacteroidota bacterium]
MDINYLSGLIVKKCLKIHKGIGPGLFESVYEEILAVELTSEGLLVEQQKVLPVYWEGLLIKNGFKADLIVEDLIIVEIKSVDLLAPVHKKQLITYLKISGYKLGLLVNFNVDLIKNGIHRIVNNL